MFSTLHYIGPDSFPLTYDFVEAYELEDRDYGIYADLHRNYVCFTCGEVWAKLMFTEKNNAEAYEPLPEPRKEWRCTMRTCPLCPPKWEDELNGSLLDNWRIDIFLLPPTALLREMNMALSKVGI